MSAATPRRPSRTETTEERKLMAQLAAGFSDEEKMRVLSCALLTLEREGLDLLVTRLGQETGGALEELMEGRDGKPERPKKGKPKKRQATKRRLVVSSAKLKQDWDGAWAQWWDCVWESTCEEGRYIEQDHHWEAPYLDMISLAEDLETAAAKIRKLIEPVFEADLDSDFSMAKTFEQTAAEVGVGLPDHMADAGGDGLGFEPQATYCLLDWEWRAARREGLSGYDFLERIRRVECSANEPDLDSEIIAEFINRLPEDDQQAILEGLEGQRQSKVWVDVLSSVHSPWFHLLQDLRRRWDPRHYLESCRQVIRKRWNLALPVLGDLRKRKDNEGAMMIAEEAISSLLNLAEGETWDPRDSLLCSRLSPWRVDGFHREVVRLLEGWQKSAQALGHHDLVWALKIQALLCKKAIDWDAVLDQFQSHPSPELEALHERLSSQWRELLSSKSIAEARGHDHKEPGPQPLTWIEGLLDALGKGRGRSAAFRQFIERWLQEVERKPDMLRRAQWAAAQLSLDLGANGRLRKKYATLHALLSSLCQEKGETTAARRRWLERCKASPLFAKMIAFWKRNVALLVPDPASTDYDRCTLWLATVQELDPLSFGRILAQWQVAHRRRRNLWKAMAARGMAIETWPVS